MNLILSTDSYKLTHYAQYPHDTETVYSYFESRKGATYPHVVFFGLQHILRQLERGITQADIEQAAALAAIHFGNPEIFNRAGWEHVFNAHGGRLPLRIKAVPEGTIVPTGNVLMTVENTDPECYWLTNHVESLLTHVWYPSTVATRSYNVRAMIKEFLEATADDESALPFMLHDFGYRGASTHESAALGGAGHLLSFKGTDTIPAMLLAMDTYEAELDDLAFSVPATEHSVMTSLGREDEFKVVDQLLDENPTGVLSVVGDSFDIHHFVNTVTVGAYRKRIEERDGVFVIRPDSCTTAEPTPATLVRWILKTVDFNMGSQLNSRGFKVLNPKVRVLWGDGLDGTAIRDILTTARLCGFSAENLIFGMGGGLLQKLNRDTQRFAFKSSAQKRGGVWHDVSKKPLDESKASKAGRLALADDGGGAFRTVLEGEAEDALRVVFEDGVMINPQSFEEIRERVALVPVSC